MVVQVLDASLRKLRAELVTFDESLARVVTAE
jgi:hypothetical protein